MKFFLFLNKDKIRAYQVHSGKIVLCKYKGDTCLYLDVIDFKAYTSHILRNTVSLKEKTLPVQIYLFYTQSAEQYLFLIKSAIKLEQVSFIEEKSASIETVIKKQIKDFEKKENTEQEIDIINFYLKTTPSSAKNTEELQPSSSKHFDNIQDILPQKTSRLFQNVDHKRSTQAQFIDPFLFSFTENNCQYEVSFIYLSKVLCFIVSPYCDKYDRYVKGSFNKFFKNKIHDYIPCTSLSLYAGDYDTEKLKKVFSEKYTLLVADRYFITHYQHLFFQRD